MKTMRRAGCAADSASITSRWYGAQLVLQEAGSDEARLPRTGGVMALGQMGNPMQTEAGRRAKVCTVDPRLFQLSQL